MIAVSQVLCVFDKSMDFSPGDWRFIHAFSELIDNWVIKFNYGHNFFVKFDALIISSIEPLLPILPFQLGKKKFEVFLFLPSICLDL